MSELNESMQTRTFLFPNAIVNVQFAELTNEKRRLQMRRIQKEAEKLLKSRERMKHADQR